MPELEREKFEAAQADSLGERYQRLGRLRQMGNDLLARLRLC